MLDVLRNSLHYTYTFYPSDEVKREVPLKIWQKPTYNWKLECENTEGTTLSDAVNLLENDSTPKPWLEYQALMNRRDLWIIVIGSVGVVPPVAFIYPILTGPLIVGLLLKPMILAGQSVSILSEQASIGYSLPPWFNSCLEPAN